MCLLCLGAILDKTLLYMISGIQTLPSEVVHLIAAGEVIDSLAAVVRELVENAIDAGATRIVISVWANQWRVRVSDNGLWDEA